LKILPILFYLYIPGKTQLYLKALPKIHLFAHLPKYSLENFLKTNESTIIGGELNNPIQNTTLL